MAQASSLQFTPVQVLQAARRAEAEGKMEYALQFYRHIVEHHVSTSEAHEAREGLLRIAEWRWGEARALGLQTAQRSPEPAEQATQNSFSATPTGRPSFVREQSFEETLSDEDQRMPQVISREVREETEGPDSSQFWGRYRGARFVAFLLSSLGWAGVMGGVLIAIAASAGAVAHLSAAGVWGLPLGVLYGIPGAAIGLLLVVAGQIAVAVFEGTSATLELLALERAKAID